MSEPHKVAQPKPYIRKPIEFKKHKLKAPVRNAAPVPEVREKQRELKQQVLDLMDKVNTPSHTKEVIRDKLWGIYLQLK